MTAKAERVRRIGWYAALVVASLVTVLCVSLLFAAFRNDSSIEAELGQATAQVESVTFDRTIINYATPDGIMHSPANGVLYPAGLAAGQLVNIEYDVGDPELARVAGRSAMNTLLPLGSMIFFTWMVAGPLLWWIRRQRTAYRRSLAPAPVPESSS
ncbi:DUF3592 domain-containing protein [Amycolatopsis sp. lyj-112]|uniref:DUF3592 domain-containing protein n=1 Tax=Amycolatopsis sp. lyj-112 TaxID=2789288 RepID=UPI00397B0BC5